MRSAVTVQKKSRLASGFHLYTSWHPQKSYENMKTWWGDEQRKNGLSWGRPRISSWEVAAVYLALPRHWQSLHDVQRSLSKKTSSLPWLLSLQETSKAGDCSRMISRTVLEKFLQWEQGDGKDSTCRTFPGGLHKDLLMFKLREFFRLVHLKTRRPCKRKTKH